MTYNAKVNLGFLLFFALSTLGMYLWGRSLKTDRKENRMVVLGSIFKENSPQTGLEYVCCYFYNHKKYTTVISYMGPPVLKIGTLLFIEVSSKDPDNCNTLYKLKVPACFSLDSMPAKGWKEIPTCDSIGTLPK
jgi:hypothetical protein